MAYESSVINLKDIPSYRFNVVCLGRPLIITLTWNTRMNCRFISIVDSLGTVILQNTALLLNNPLKLSFDAKNDNFDCDLMLLKKIGYNGEIDHLNWSKSMFLAFRRNIVIV